MIQDALKTLFNGGSLTREEARAAMDELMAGRASGEQIAAFLGVLRGKRETVPELTGFAESLRAHAVSVPVKRNDLIDTCGTGGDGAQTFNISTASAFILAAAGLGVAKHGNRSVSSRCGSADVLEALGVAIEAAPEVVADSIDRYGFGFLFAPQFHPAMHHVAPVRRALGVRTFFNILGPLANPAKAKRQVIGVFDRNLIERLCYVLDALGAEEVMVVAGADGLDELSLSGETYVGHLKSGAVSVYTVHPSDANLVPAGLDAIQGGDATFNAKLIQRILGGERGAPRDVVCLNAAAALIVAGKAADFREGAALAGEMLDSGRAAAVLSQVTLSQVALTDVTQLTSGKP